MTFPKNFLWGAATSAHQVEGGNKNDWTEWEKLGRIARGEQSGMAVDHFRRFREDFALAKELGHNAHRFSIEWSRVEPEPGRFDAHAIEHYREVINELRRLGIEPMVTLHHFTNPLWIARAKGWVNKRTVEAFVRYANKILESIGQDIRYWITLNEPTVYTSLGYINGYWPPERKNFIEAWIASRNMLAAHRRTYNNIHAVNPHALVGVANNLNDFVAVRPGHILDEGLRRFAEYWHGQWWLDRTATTQDFIGLNYYFHHPLKFRFTTPIKLFHVHARDDKPVSDVGWQIHPEGLGRILRWLHTRYKKPIIVTENGIADAFDRIRAGFIRDHVEQVSNALSEGIDVRGYLYWSLTDNFEWREGFAPRFGLVEVDYKTMERRIRPSAYAYRKLCLTNGGSL